MRPPLDESPRMVHHVLLNHIAVVSTYTQLLQDSALDDDQKELLSELAISVEHAHTLATELGRQLQLHHPADSSDADTGGQR